MMHEDGISYCDLCSPLTESCVVMTYGQKKVQDVLCFNPTLTYTWCDDGSIQLDTCPECLLRYAGIQIDGDEDSVECEE